MSPARRRRAGIVATASFALGLAACARRTPPHATAIDAERAHISIDELEHGRTLLVAKCGSRCHKTPLPTDKRASEWPHVLDVMAPRANLDAEQRHAIEQYLIAMSAR